MTPVILATLLPPASPACAEAGRPLPGTRDDDRSGIGEVAGERMVGGGGDAKTAGRRAP